MVAPESVPRRTFTVPEANATLPLVRAIVADLVRLAHEVSDRSERLSALLASRPLLDRGDPYANELAHIVRELQRDRHQLREYADELLDLGVEPHSAIEGHVHFPAILSGRQVHLCWKLGEPEVLFWHEVGESVADRCPVDIGTRSGDELVAGGRGV
jgi:hypothetical protein